MPTGDQIQELKPSVEKSQGMFSSRYLLAHYTTFVPEAGNILDPSTSGISVLRTAYGSADDSFVFACRHQ